MRSGPIAVLASALTLLCSLESAQGGIIVPDGRPRERVPAINSLALGADNNIWFGVQVVKIHGHHSRATPNGYLGRYDPETGKTSTFKFYERQLFGNADIGDVIAGPNNAVWFIAYDEIGYMSTSGGKQSGVYSNAIAEESLAVGPDGALWSQRQSMGNGVTVRLSADGDYSSFTDPNPIGYQAADAIYPIAGPGGNLWSFEVTSPQSGGIAEMTTSGQLLAYYVIGEFCCGSSIAYAPDGNIYATEVFGGGVVQVTPQGQFTQLPNAAGAVLVAPDSTDYSVWYAAGSVINEYSLSQETLTSYPAVGAVTTFLVDHGRNTVWYATGGSQIYSLAIPATLKKHRPVRPLAAPAAAFPPLSTD